MLSETIPELYVLWHPRFAQGAELARRIHRWLRPQGMGPQVYYRSLPAPEAPANGLPPPLPKEARMSAQMAARYQHSSLCNLQIVLLLIDAQMIADPTWRYWIESLGATAEAAGRKILPVALDGSAFNVPPALRELNFLRPQGLPSNGAAADWPPETLETVARSLLKQLTEALCELLLFRDPAPDTPPGEAKRSSTDTKRAKIMIFLSHAKADGTEPAKLIRDYIYSQTQIAAFFDENDIPVGSRFAKVLESSVDGPAPAAALIAVRSECYAERPWCRRELALFRRPRKVCGDEDQSQLWALNPTLMVDALEDGKITVGLPELGASPVIRWSKKVERQEELIVTTLLRDVLLAAHHRAVARHLLELEDCVVLNWIPDPGSLMLIPRLRRPAGELKVYYPGRGLAGTELQTLKDFFPDLQFLGFDRIVS